MTDPRQEGQAVGERTVYLDLSGVIKSTKEFSNMAIDLAAEAGTKGISPEFLLCILRKIFCLVNLYNESKRWLQPYPRRLRRPFQKQHGHQLILKHIQ